MKSTKPNKRRVFLKNMIALGSMTALAPQLLNAKKPQPAFIDKDDKGFTFLFQGDSITDGNRTRDNDWNHVMGHGYQYIIASRLWYDFPEKRFRFFNRESAATK